MLLIKRLFYHVFDVFLSEYNFEVLSAGHIKLHFGNIVFFTPDHAQTHNGFKKENENKEIGSNEKIGWFDICFGVCAHNVYVYDVVL